MRFVAVEFITLDGVVQAPGHAGEDPGGFDHGGWSQPFFDDHRRYFAGTYRIAQSFLFGRKTFEIFEAYWPTVVDSDDPIATALNTKPKYVVSSTLTDATWSDTTILSGGIDDAIDQLRVLKADLNGDMFIIGSSELVRRLTEDGLIDEYQLLTHPVIVGAGKRLFPDSPNSTVMDVVDVTVTPSGLIIATYRPTTTTTDTVAERHDDTAAAAAT